MRVSTLTLASAAALGAALMSVGPALALAAQPTTELNVRVGPSTETAVLYTLSAGQLIDVVSCGSGWCRLGSGGFVSEAYLVPPGSAAPVVPAPAPYHGASAPAPVTAAYTANPGAPAGPPAYGDPYPAGAPGGYASANPAPYGHTGGAGYPESWYGGHADARGAGYPASWYGHETGGDPAGWNNGYDAGGDPAGWNNGYADCWAEGAGGFGGYGDPYEFTAGDPWPRAATRFEFRVASEPESFPFAFGIESTVRPPACFYDRPGYRGDGFCRFAQVTAPHMLRRWDDRIGSVYVHPGYAVEVCTGDNFTGYCRTLTSSDNWVGRVLDDNISSYRVYRR